MEDDTDIVLYGQYEFDLEPLQNMLINGGKSNETLKDNLPDQAAAAKL